jgi:hypothetical protein
MGDFLECRRAANELVPSVRVHLRLEEDERRGGCEVRNVEEALKSCWRKSTIERAGTERSSELEVLYIVRGLGMCG